jgi:hypothetical protein
MMDIIATAQQRREDSLRYTASSESRRHRLKTAAEAGAEFTFAMGGNAQRWWGERPQAE